MWVGATNVAPLLKAFKKFDTFRFNDRTEQEKAGPFKHLNIALNLFGRS